MVYLSEGSEIAPGPWTLDEGPHHHARRRTAGDNIFTALFCVCIFTDNVYTEGGFNMCPRSLMAFHGYFS